MRTIGQTLFKGASVVLALVLMGVAAPAFAQKLTDAQLKTLTASAKTAQDYQKLATHYRTHAAEHDADAAVHEEIVLAYRKRVPFTDDIWDITRDASHYAEHSKEAAQAMRDLAAAYQSLADEAAKKK